MPRVGGGRCVSRLGSVCPRSPALSRAKPPLPPFSAPVSPSPRSLARSLTHRPVRAPARPPARLLPGRACARSRRPSPPGGGDGGGGAPQEGAPSPLRPSPPLLSPPAPPGAGRGLGAAGARPGAAGASAWGTGTGTGAGGRRSAGGEEVVVAVPARRPLAGSGSPGRRAGPAVGRWRQQRAWAGAAAGTKDRAGGGRRGPAVASPRQGGRECMSPASQLPPCPRAEVRAHGRPGEGAAVPGQGRCEAKRSGAARPPLSPSARPSVPRLLPPHRGE